MKSIELFAGAGGLALGVSEAGFEHTAVIEWDKYSCDTIRDNQYRGVEPFNAWPLIEGDVSEFDYSALQGNVDLVSGGPPCQPFSIGGKHQAYNDRRDMFPEAVRAVRELTPNAFIFENVRGLVRPRFYNYFKYVCLQLEFPELIARSQENWRDHFRRLEFHKTEGSETGLHYNLVSQVLNAADFGVPQKRERIFIVGFRSDLHCEWSFPFKTHTKEALLHSQWISGEYWDRHKISAKKRPAIPPTYESRILRHQTSLELSEELPWVTVRDAISDLPEPAKKGTPSAIPNHNLQPGARAYPGHTGSALDEPAKALKAGDHGVPGGENMLARPDGSVRYFSVRESARIQTFPDRMLFHGSWTESMRQLGNAVPVRLASTVAGSVAKSLLSQHGKTVKKRN